MERPSGEIAGLPDVCTVVACGDEKDLARLGRHDRCDGRTDRDPQTLLDARSQCDGRKVAGAEAPRHVEKRVVSRVDQAFHSIIAAGSTDRNS